jgi:hypothetical protein
VWHAVMDAAPEIVVHHQAGGVWSFVHVVDAATATVEAIEHGTAGIYQVVDD